MKNLVSIIVPVFNTDKYLAKCLESILSQSYQNIELLIIDDGSTDDSAMICDRYTSDSRVTIFRKSNGGQSSARNIGLNMSRGEYIVFVDSDDWIYSNMIETMLCEIVDSDFDVIACNIEFENADGTYSKFYNGLSNSEFNKVQAMKEILQNERLTYSPCNKIYSKKLFDNLRFDENIILEDIEITYKLIHKCEKIKYLCDALYHYRYNPNSTMRSEFTLKRLDEFTVFSNMRDFYSLNYPELLGYVNYRLINCGQLLYVELMNSPKYKLKDFDYLIKFRVNEYLSCLRLEDIKISNKFRIILSMVNRRISVYIVKIILEKREERS